MDRSRDDTEPHARPRARASTLAIIPAVALAILALDQGSKALVVATMTEGQTIEVLGPVLQWHFVRNPGAAFSLGAGSTWIFSIVAAAVVAVIVLFARRIRSPLWAGVFGLVLGGALGNLADRLFREPGFGVGHVVDFISTPWMMPAIYNVADSAIVVAMCALVVLTLLDRRMDGSSPRSRAAGGTSEAAAPRDVSARDASFDVGAPR